MSKSQPAPHIVSLTRHLFGDKVFAQWNSGSYHDSRHAMYVAEVIMALAGHRRRQPDRKLFLAQVALLHDADPRPAGKPTPASVFRTIEWMWLHKEGLLETLCWTNAAFDTALALIARTEFPFDDSARKSNTVLNGMSPYTTYRNLMLGLNPSEREMTFEDAQMLRFADQCANYCRDFATASRSVDDLSREMHNVGRPISRWDLDTPTFLESLASDSHWDRCLKGELGLTGRVLNQAELLHLLSQPMLDNLRRNTELFRNERQRCQRASG